MNTSRKLHVVVGALILGVVTFCLSPTAAQRRTSYEVEAQVYGIPGYQSDASRAIAAYERAMDRHMDLMERNVLSVAADVQVLSVKLDAVDARLARIEEHLGIVTSPPRLRAPDPNAGASPAGSLTP